jgi:hypothetical protein
MQIPSFIPKITPGVVGFSPSSLYHLGFVCVCVCTSVSNNTSSPQSARHRHPPSTSPTLVYSLNQRCGKDFRSTEKIQFLPSCQRFYMYDKPVFQKRKMERKKEKKGKK